MGSGNYIPKYRESYQRTHCVHTGYSTVAEPRLARLFYNTTRQSVINEASNEMNLEAQLNSLQKRLTDVLRQLPGATALYLHGSRAGGRTDGYADLDLQVCTSARITRAIWPQFLERVGPLEAAWPLNGAADNSAFTILFKGESYYHKVDIGLSEGGSGGALNDTGVKLWAQPPAPELTLIPKSAVYLPAHGSVGYQVLDELIASERYLKARKRGQYLLCWRFMRVKPDRLLQLLRSQRQGWQPYDQPLTTWEIKALESTLSADERAQFTSHLACSEPAVMDANMLWFTEEIIRLLEGKATAKNETLPMDIIERHLAFLHNELG